MANPTPRYRYDERAGRFRDSRTGRFVAPSVVNAALGSVIDTAAADMRMLSQQLQAGSVSLKVWQLGMEQGIKNMHLASAALAKGGWRQLTQADFGRIGAIVKREYQYLRKLAADVAGGKQKLNGTFLQRAQEYMRAGKTTYNEVLKREHEKRQETYVRNVRHARDSCPGCIAQSELGWVNTSDPRLVPPGRRTCRGYCKCEWEFTTAEALGATEAA